jgi:DNA-nicking Smr family endonuclease
MLHFLQMAKKVKGGFHTPFVNLKLPPAPPAPPPATPPPPVADPVESDERVFSAEMQGVAPLPPDPRGRLGAPAPVRTFFRPRAQDEAEAYAELADLVAGDGLFDLSATDEYIQGSAAGLDRRIVKKLRRGDFAVQAHLDLHGMTGEEARVEVAAFLIEARTAGKRCVLIIHGRGLNSKEGIPVLKERLQVWLTRGPFAKSVLAFSTARPSDGGTGALYVLLRK